LCVSSGLVIALLADGALDALGLVLFAAPRRPLAHAGLVARRTR